MLKTFLTSEFNLQNLFFKFINFAFIILISVFIYLGFDEINIVQELQNIINTNLNIVHNFIYAKAHYDTQKENPYVPSQFDKFMHDEVQGQILKSNHAVNFMVESTAGSVLLLLIIWSYLYVNYKRLQSLNQNRPKLQDLLYDSLVKQIHPDKESSLPTQWLKIQQERHLFIKEVNNALMNKEFILYYQPIIDAESGLVTEIEALLRWQHPQFGFLTPDKFLPLCELTECIIPIAEYVIHQVCQQMRDWNILGYSYLSVAINLSAKQLNDMNLRELLIKELAIHDILPSQLNIEITESMIMENMQEKIKLLKSIKQLGITLSLDDFGTGFASLNYIKHFPFDILKIDKSFVSDMTNNITSTAIIESIITLSKNLGLSVVAEGVETEQQFKLLKEMKCDLLQGYLFSKPLPPFEMIQLLNDKNQTMHRTVKQNRPIDCHFEIMTNHHYDQAVALITQSFCEYEPMTQYLKLSPVAFTPFAESIVKAAIKDGLSMVALHQNQMIACTIVEDLADPADLNNVFDPKFKIIFNLLENLGKDFFSKKSFEKGHIAHLFITAVHKDYFGRGLSRMINFQTMNLAKQKEFDFMYCEFTHAFNEKGTVKYIQSNKFRIKSINYQDFIFEGKRPFEHLPGGANAYIWELHDGARLNYQILTQ